MTRRRAHGSLETVVLQLLWARDAPQTSRAIRDALAVAGAPLASTTVLTVLARLAKKGLIQRDPVSKAFSATRIGTVQTAASMAQLLERAGDRHAALRRFARNLRTEDRQALRATLNAIGTEHPQTESAR